MKRHFSYALAQKARRSDLNVMLHEQVLDVCWQEQVETEEVEKEV